MSGRNLKAARLAGAFAAVAVLAGCASVSSDRGFGTVSALAKQRLGQDVRLLRNDDDARALDALITEKLRTPLTADDAVQIALLNNRALQSTYWNVGIAHADLVQAGRLKNPSFAFQRTRQGDAVDIERSLTFNLVGLLTAPLATRIENRRFEQTRLMVADDILKHAAKTRLAYFDAVAAVQGLAYARQVAASAEASFELTGRMAQAGNVSRLDLARQQVFQAEATAAVARAGKHAVASREHLARLMGLWGTGSAYLLPDRLPDLPAAAAEIKDIERIAVRERLDIQAARIEAAHTASSLGLTKTTRFINVFDLGYVRNAAAGEAAAPGYAISLELPLFDWGGARVARSEAIYMQAVNKVAQAAVEARSEARETYLDYRTSYDLARHYRDQVIPLRKKISDETMLRYNGMLVSVFELLADAREQAAAVNSTIDALKEYWMAHTRLEAALGGHLPAQPATANKGTAR
ncbi:MAG: transporter [Massilia sp.]|jgi:outer membrane protein TolC|nr:transporter [Massilia sp.]